MTYMKIRLWLIPDIVRNTREVDFLGTLLECYHYLIGKLLPLPPVDF